MQQIIYNNLNKKKINCNKIGIKIYNFRLCRIAHFYLQNIENNLVNYNIILSFKIVYLNNLD